MLRKITIALAGLVVIIALGGGIWYVLKYLPKPKEQTVSTIPQGWKTYVSKYGFSVSYPPDWQLEELRDVKPSEMEYKGYMNFALVRSVPSKPRVSIEFLFINKVLSGSWGNYTFGKGYTIDSLDKMLFLLEKMNQYKVSERGKIDKIVKLDVLPNLMICMIYYKKKDPWQAYFYLPKWDTLAYLSIDANSEEDEILTILRSIRYVSNK